MARLKLSDALVSRIKSFTWRLAGVTFIAVINFAWQEVQGSSLSPEWVTVIGLLVGEITKFYNSNWPYIK